MHQLRCQDRDRRERFLHESEVPRLARLPLLEVAVDGFRRKHAIADHQIGEVPVQIQVGVCALRFLDHHLLGVHHQPHARFTRVRQDVTHPLELDEDVARGIEHVLRRHRQVRHALQDRSGNARGDALDRKDVLQPPGHHFGEAQQPQRLARRRAVDDHRVVRLVVVVRQQVQQPGQLFHAGEHRHLLGDDLVEAAPCHEDAEPLLELAPVDVDLAEDIEFLGE